MKIKPQSWGSVVTAEPGSPPKGMYVPIHFPNMGTIGSRTRDGRLIDAETFGGPFDLPRSIKLKVRDAEGHMGAEVAGRLDHVAVDEDGVLSGDGWLNADPIGERAAYLLSTQSLRGNSMDLSVEAKDVSVRGVEEDGKFWVEVDFANAKIRATTLLTEPAFDSASAVIPAGWDVAGYGETDALVASIVAADEDHEPAFAFNVVSERPKLDHEAFQDPKLTGPTPRFVDEGNRIKGHVALWRSEHLDVKIPPPRSHSNYAYFATHPLLTTEGWVSVGPMVMNGDHAAKTLGYREALDHYANTCAAWGDVCIGEDAYGIWVAGMVRPGTPNEMIHAAACSGESGDWRRIGARLEFIATLAVNTPAYPIPRAESFGHDPDFALTVLGAGGVGARSALASPPLVLPPEVTYLANRFAAQDAEALLADWDAQA